MGVITGAALPLACLGVRRSEERDGETGKGKTQRHRFGHVLQNKTYLS